MIFVPDLVVLFLPDLVAIFIPWDGTKNTKQKTVNLFALDVLHRWSCFSWNKLYRM